VNSEPTRYSDRGERYVHPIEAESYRILGERVDLSAFPSGPARVLARVVHATADPTLVDDLVVEDSAVHAGVAAIRSRATMICDVEMVRSGITGYPCECLLNELDITEDDLTRYRTRTAAGVAHGALRAPLGSILVVGCAPTALFALNEQIKAGSVRPALVVGVPVGFVGAADAKEQLIELCSSAGIPFIVLRGERGGAAIAVAIVNALLHLANEDHPGEVPRPATNETREQPTLFLIGHGTRSDEGARQLRSFIDAVAKKRPDRLVESGFIEFVEPELVSSITALAASGVRDVVALPLVLLGAGHMKDDGPVALLRARQSARRTGPGRTERGGGEVNFSYARDLGVHPAILAVAEQRVREASETLSTTLPDAVVVVSRGSSDPDANSDLAKAARLLADGRRLTVPVSEEAGNRRDSTKQTIDPPPPLSTVLPAFVSLARPDVPLALDQCYALGARRIVVLPYFLFTGLLVDRIHDQSARWSSSRPDVEVAVAEHFGSDERIVDLVWQRYDEAVHGEPHMNCDGCIYRVELPGYEQRVGAAPFGG
jgi:sirohydrochlorin cobaltochelatase